MLIDGQTRSFHGWMIGLVFWLSISVGLLLLTMIHHVFDAGWSVVVRRQYEHALTAMPWIALGVLPLIAASYIGGNPGVVWTWMNPDAEVAYSPAFGWSTTVSEDALFLHKEIYLNKPFFVLRTILYLGLFIWLASKMRQFSFSMDRDGRPHWVNRSRIFSAFGVITSGLALSFLAFDWMMSLNFHWFSTMYGVWFFSASIRAALCVAILLLFYQTSKGVLKGYFNLSHFYLMGCMLLAFTMFWAYISFSQYFLIYNANIPEVTFWYNIREKAGWWTIGMFLVFGGFLLPFLALLLNRTKVVPKLLAGVAGWILLMTILDFYYNIIPHKIPVERTVENPYAYVVPSFGINIVDIATLIGFGGIFLWGYFSSVAKQKLVPVRDPRILESIHYQK